MEVKPIKRIWLSLISVSFRNASRHAPGIRKGRSPSSTSMRANAMPKVSHIPEYLLRPAGLPQYAVALGRDHGSSAQLYSVYCSFYDGAAPASERSQRSSSQNYGLGGLFYFVALPVLSRYLKNSELGSTTIRSLLFLKLCL